MGAPRVAAVVLNYNGRELTLKALRSVLACDYPALEVIHLDNGSSDGSREAVATAFPAVVQVRTESNVAVAGGYNLGIKAAIERGAEYVLLLNNDVEADPGLVKELVAVAELEPRSAAVGPKTYYLDDRRRLFSAGGRLRFRESITAERGHGEVDRGQYDQDGERPYVNGNGMLIRRRALADTGWLDPQFHLAVEDADWCRRARAMGYTIGYAHRAVLYHAASATLGAYVARRTYFSGRSSALFARRYAGPLDWLTYFGALAIALPLAWLRELMRGNQGAAVAKLRGVIAGLFEPMGAPPRFAPPGPAEPLPPAPPGLA